MEPEYTNIYLMKNERNGFTKIGRSKHPFYREKQLQSEEPEISMIDHVFAHRVWESELHMRFNAKRIRGEWFSLTDDEIDSVRSLFKKKREWNTAHPELVRGFDSV